MILVDTSIWIDHLRKGNKTLSYLLESNRIAVHPMVIGELACGHLQNRYEILTLLQQLPSIKTGNEQEVLYTIEQRQWMGKGIGYIDAHLLTSVLLSPSASLWTNYKRLYGLAEQNNVAFNEKG